MTKLLSLEEKLNKILEYCEYTKQSINAGHNLRYLVEIDNTVDIGTEQQRTACVQIGYAADTGTFLRNTVCKAVLEAKQYSIAYNCLSSVKVWIEIYNSKCELIDEDPIDEYEINFENGIEVQ